MEVAGFAVGLSGLISVFDKACEVWCAIAAAKDFGDDVDGSIRKLEIEFFRFQSWWKVIQKLEILPARPVGQLSNQEIPFLAAHLSNTAQNPIVSIAQSILGILQEIESLFRESGVLQVMESQNSQSLRNGMPAQPKPIRDQIADMASARNRMSHQLMSAIPWRKRVKHDATPWRSSNKERLETKLGEMVYWNGILYSILPLELKNSILRQGISGYMLADTGETKFLSELDNSALSQQAKLFEAYRKLTITDSKVSTTVDEVRARLIDLNTLGPVRLEDDQPFTVVRSSNDQDAPCFLIEWYQLPEIVGAEFELRSIARERLAKLSVLLSAENKPSTLCAAESIGYVEANDLYRFGLVSRIPAGVSRTPPVSLYSLLCREPLPGTSIRAPLPTLSQRFRLASSLATSLYTFMLTRWHHKMFNSLNTYFLFPKTEGKLPDLSNPLVGGYTVSRPSAMGEISIGGTHTTLSETYLHPQLRVPPHERPKYVSKYEIYALGLLLAEIGFWQPISKIAAAKPPRHSGHSAEGLKKAVVDKTSSDLACWMGEQYRDVTRRCLEIDDTLDKRIGNGLADFYWNVVLELVRCDERVRLIGRY
ncbi:hypothetical protein B0O99DRAFT_678815 [Bisporella sp. PMI_857]|nr:hypothetical protein B0O99DRAFT_678815 [Bisporella sp. PMI_857]